MMSARINLPADIFSPPEDEEQTQPRRRVVEPSPLEKYLGRTRDPETGKLVPRKKKSKSKTVAASTFDRTRIETQAMIESKDWEGCQARHLVALYDLMHEKAYKVAPDMSAKDRYFAAGRASNFVKRTFGGDYTKAVEYFRWVWTREMRTEKWCRENRIERNKRLGINLMFSGSLVTDYRVALARNSRD